MREVTEAKNNYYFKPEFEKINFFHGYFQDILKKSYSFP